MDNYDETKVQPQDEKEAASALQHLSESKADDDGDKFAIPELFTKSGRKKAVPFPLKLMKVLSTKDFQHIITWMPSGKSFSIIEPKAFVAEILPEHFKSAKYASFTRKLHRWGFMRHYRGEESGAFYHKNFQKDCPDLVDDMKCHKAEPQALQAIRKMPKQQPEAPTLAQNAALPVQQQQQMPQLNMSCLSDQIDAAERLNAAIELEVARRLKERIQAAALSRHTLALMNQFSQPQPTSLQAQLLQMQQRKQQLGFNVSFANKNRKQPLAAAPHLEKQGLQELPHTNIQSAKTA